MLLCIRTKSVCPLLPVWDEVYKQGPPRSLGPAAMHILISLGNVRGRRAGGAATASIQAISSRLKTARATRELSQLWLPKLLDSARPQVVGVIRSPIGMVDLPRYVNGHPPSASVLRGLSLQSFRMHEWRDKRPRLVGRPAGWRTDGCREKRQRRFARPSPTCFTHTLYV